MALKNRVTWNELKIFNVPELTKLFLDEQVLS